MKVVLAAFYTPGIRGIEYFIQAGLRPEDICLLTHDVERNRPLLAFAGAHCIETQTFSVNSDQAFEWIEAFKPDVLFSLYFRDIVPQRVLDIPRLGGVNLHPALLPRYRGTFSAPWVIINGEEHTGFTYHYMARKVDTGNIVLQRPVVVRPEDTAYALYHRLIQEGMTAFGEAVRLVAQEHYRGIPQEGKGSYYPREVPFGGYVNPGWDRERIDRFIRALYFPPFKGALVRMPNGEDREVPSIAEYDALAESQLKA